MQATGNLTLGNYLGALKNWVTLSDEYECFYGVVDMHSITVRQDPATLRKRARALLTLYIAAGLDPEKKYHFTNRQLHFDLKDFGSLVNQVSPIHIKQNSLLHNVANSLVKMHGEIEDCVAKGDLLMKGIKLKQGFGATGYAEDIRFFSDFGSRMYFMEEVE